jgi:hypothetical protein
MDIEAKIAEARKGRTVVLFDVPERLAEEVGVHQVGLVTLTADEELQCFGRARGNSARLAAELAKASLAEADGRPLTSADGSVDSWFGKADPRLRQLVLAAYAEIHAANAEDADAFLKSRKTRLG